MLVVSTTSDTKKKTRAKHKHNAVNPVRKLDQEKNDIVQTRNSVAKCLEKKRSASKVTKLVPIRDVRLC